MPLTSPIIDVRDVGFTYGRNPVLEHVTFSIEAGDYVGILGPNGSGKTTLLKILVGLLTPNSGTVSISDTPIAEFRNRCEIGYVPQRIATENASFPVTVYEVVESGRTAAVGLFHRFGKEDRSAIRDALAIAGIAALQQRLMSTLSGGERQRAYVARALACHPRILILDEPFVGIDVAAQKEFYAFLKELNERQGLTILFVSHDVDVIADEVKSVLCLNRTLMCFGKPSLLHQPHVIEELYGRKITHIHRSA